MGKPVESLSPEERIAYYRGMAAEALRLAIGTTDLELKVAHLDTAARWVTLAIDVRNWERDAAGLRSVRRQKSERERWRTG